MRVIEICFGLVPNKSLGVCLMSVSNMKKFLNFITRFNAPLIFASIWSASRNPVTAKTWLFINISLSLSGCVMVCVEELCKLGRAKLVNINRISLNVIYTYIYIYTHTHTHVRYMIYLQIISSNKRTSTPYNKRCQVILSCVASIRRSTFHCILYKGL